MTPAPTNEIAIGIKIIDFAIVPHQILSARLAIINPKAVLKVGTTINHPRLFNNPLLNSGSLKAHK